MITIKVYDSQQSGKVYLFLDYDFDEALAWRFFSSCQNTGCGTMVDVLNFDNFEGGDSEDFTNFQIGLGLNETSLQYELDLEGELDYDLEFVSLNGIVVLENRFGVLVETLEQFLG